MVKKRVRSMTGYGMGRAQANGGSITVEIRAVNHRFLDLKIRGLHVSSETQDKLGSVLRKDIERGSVSLFVRGDSKMEASTLKVNVDVAKVLHQQIAEMASELGLTGEVDIMTLAGQPGVISKLENHLESPEWVASLLKAAEQAVSELVDMRNQEGSTLKADIEARLSRIGELAIELGKIAAQSPADAQARLQDRLAKLVSKQNIEVDEARVAQEIALLVDRMDVTEETVRIQSHIKQFQTLMNKGGGVGRRMDFLIQEFSREFNTIASKSQHADAAKYVVEAKAELEKMREQVQNIE